MKENAIIFGDSYSTFRGFIPDGYAVHYHENIDDGSGVTDVSKTWWHQVMNEANLNLVLNDSWSGSTICYTGYDNFDASTSNSFIYRLRKMKGNGFFSDNKIDKVFVFGGTNDSWSNAPLGEPRYEDFKEDEFYCVLPAVCYFFSLLKETLPQAEIFCMVNTEIKEEISSCMKHACEKYGIVPITFEHIEKSIGHPTVKGMQEIKNEVLKVLNR